MRVTTNSTLRTYRSSLARATLSQYNAMNLVLSDGRLFNSFADSPARATESYRLHSAYAKNQTQQETNATMVGKFEQAHSSMQQISDQYNKALEQAMKAQNTPTGGALKELGTTLKGVAEGMVYTLNVKYGDKYVFAGADGDNAPFELRDDGTLLFRGVDVNSLDPASTDPAVQEALKMLDEHAYVDVGLGFALDGNQEVIPSTAFDSSISGLKIMGYGTDDNGNPNNMISIISRLGQIYSQADEEGNLPTQPNDLAAEAEQLFGKMKDSFTNVNTQWATITSRAQFLDSNETRLVETGDNLTEQFTSVDKTDMADALTTFAYAQYTYNAALRVGNQVLSQSFIDYMG
ncbi:MAG TPA: hypothetical protein H9746_04180 [Candidatus Butyricicoccus avistercoris]|uniref:Flagellar hook-associated protein 3 n=1 Tax=Candidatus Butyricicoccus avistercoris TaxID=2838518 RepID=A0A9D1PJ32_9FIRM|nr:hypothetical protein [Candidatus Butyricicoccus avistercoris]